jgi:hypothetical protein
MRGFIPSLPNTPSWRGAQLKRHRDKFTFDFNYLKRETANSGSVNGVFRTTLKGHYLRKVRDT